MTILGGVFGYPQNRDDVDVQMFTTGGTRTWAKPAGAKWVRALVVGPGGGGGSGAKYPKFDDAKAYLDGSGYRLPGFVNATNQNFASIPDNAALRPTGDFELVLKLAFDTFTPGTIRGIIWNGTSTGGSTLNYYLYQGTGGGLILLRPTAAASRQYNSAGLGMTVGEPKWLRVVFDVDNGAGASAASFYKGDDGVNWTLVNTATVANTTVGNSVASPFRVGADGGTTNMMTGTVYRAKFISDPFGTPVTVADLNFETAPANALTFTESSVNAATVTISQAGLTRGGGGGGGPGGFAVVEFDANLLPATVPVRVGLGADGGTAITANNTNGNSASASRLNEYSAFGIYAGTRAGGSGAGGTPTAGGGGGSAGASNADGCQFDTGSGFAGIYATRSTGSLANLVSSGGGGGGSVTSTDAMIGPTPAPTARPNAGSYPMPGFVGGNGGAASISSDAEAGANGGPGCGGGGGGAGVNGFNSGAGGRGGDGAVIITSWLGPIDIQHFTSSGTWVKPTDSRLTWARIICVGGGGGGGTGRRGAAGTARVGGGGGGGSGWMCQEVPLSQLPNFVNVSVAAGGIGALPAAGDNADGNTGGDGGTSHFGTIAWAEGGKGGRAGGSGAGGTGGAAGAPLGNSGGSAATNGSSAPTNGVLQSTYVYGGAGGGGINSGNSPSNGMGTYSQRLYTGISVTGVGASAASPLGNGAGLYGGLGGGGQAGNSTLPGGNGANGGGGAGGSATLNGVTGGSGGNGGDGRVTVVCF